MNEFCSAKHQLPMATHRPTYCSGHNNIAVIEVRPAWLHCS